MSENWLNRNAEIRISYWEKYSGYVIYIKRDEYDCNCERLSYYYGITALSAARLKKVLESYDWITYTYERPDYPDYDGTPNAITETVYLHIFGAWQGDYAIKPEAQHKTKPKYTYKRQYHHVDCDEIEL